MTQVVISFDYVWKKSVMDQPKLERLLKVMKLLTSNRSKTVEEIARNLGITKRSVYRYIDTFREAGFVIKKEGEFHRLDKNSPYFKEISELIHFTDEEAYLLKSAIESIDETNIIKQNLKKKLYTVYNYKILAETITNSQHSKNINALVEAIEQQKSVVLCDYASANSSEIRNRKVEAFAFTTNYVQLWCLDLEDNTTKLFNVSRIGKVEILSEHWNHQEKHKIGHIDIFRYHTNQSLPIRLKLSLRAYNLLVEEFPLAKSQTKAIGNNQWLLETQVCSYDGVGRFVLGLAAEEIEILEPQEFKEIIQKQAEKILSKP